jgi:hypothetical protein
MCCLGSLLGDHQTCCASSMCVQCLLIANGKSWLGHTNFGNHVVQCLISGMDVEDLFFPILLVVGESPDKLEIELVQVFPCLAAAVLNPTKHDDVVDDVLQHMELDYFPALAFPCIHQESESSIVLLCACSVYRCVSTCLCVCTQPHPVTHVYLICWGTQSCRPSGAGTFYETAL